MLQTVCMAYRVVWDFRRLQEPVAGQLIRLDAVVVRVRAAVVVVIPACRRRHFQDGERSRAAKRDGQKLRRWTGGRILGAGALTAGSVPRRIVPKLRQFH